MATGFAGRPLVVDTKASQIRKRLADAIVDGELQPGDRLVLDEIARQLGVSKIPLREALSSLEGAGLVVTTPHTGPRVAPLPFHELRGIYHLRERVETLGMELAVDGLDGAAVDALREINETMKRRLRRADVVELSDLNAEFHLSIARASGYSTVAEVVSELLTKVRRYRAIVPALAANWEHAVIEHDQIIEAIKSGDRARAIETMRAHVHTQGRLEGVEGILEEKGNAQH
ncbi:GntR family transcriptional regulator [Microbacterium sp. Au-Mic1]|uniref:GntR family transcriptional regulator n=1 Tax=Microbacterium sp. Au-Mic1 TaxID=2906457 RepID=UPI001E5C04A8|nr:GntR family transcriptional regulator [Microbacterium sp. Au-Mic1]MCE4026276.1 GntR family transcriptional regulator [Microbacterium sp. Au-Mic1]